MNAEKSFLIFKVIYYIMNHVDVTLPKFLNEWAGEILSIFTTGKQW